MGKNNIAPRAALLTALWGDDAAGKLRLLLVFGSGAYVHRITAGSRVFDPSLPDSLVFVGAESTAFHTLFFQVSPV